MEVPIATYVVTNVRKALAEDGSHRHIDGVCTRDGSYYSRELVVESIKRGNTWITSADGVLATITTLRYCPHPTCLASPYITTRPDSTAKDNLENLDEC